jgi:hypothetical protein
MWAAWYDPVRMPGTRLRALRDRARVIWEGAKYDGGMVSMTPAETAEYRAIEQEIVALEQMPQEG